MPVKKKPKAKTCPVCVMHNENRSRFYDKPEKIGKILVSGKCSVCGYKEEK